MRPIERIDNFIDKKAARNKEGVYFAFPFSSALNTTMVDAGYGSMQYLKDQLPGSNMDFLSTRRWLDASDDKKGIQLGMKEAFMAAPDSMVDEPVPISKSVNSSSFSLTGKCSKMMRWSACCMYRLMQL